MNTDAACISYVYDHSVLILYPLYPSVSPLLPAILWMSVMHAMP